MKNSVVIGVIMISLAVFADVFASAPVSHGNAQSATSSSSGGNALERAGGLVSRPASERAYKVVNAQNIVREDMIREVVDEFADRLQLPVKLVSGAEYKDDCVKGPALVLAMKCEHSVLVVKPEEGIAWISITELAADKPAMERLELRVRKEMWRGFVYSLGGGNTTFPHCVMKPVATMADLDAITSLSACPEAFNAVLAGADKFGISGVRTTTYLRACREGWAPKPVNDIQQAIWNEVKNPASRWEKDFDNKGR